MSLPRKRVIRRYSSEFLRYGFIPDEDDEQKPYCLLCRNSLTNDSMRTSKLQLHFRIKHQECSSFDLNHFQLLAEKFKKRHTVPSLFSTTLLRHNRTLKASYEISLLIAKNSKNHTIGEKLIKPAISIFLKTVLENNDNDANLMPLSNSTVSTRIDEMGGDVENQLVEKLQNRKFSLQVDESTIRDSEALLLTYVRYIDNEAFQEEMLFCKALKTTTTAVDIYTELKGYFDDKKIPVQNILSIAADGAPAMMGKKNGCLKLFKDENPEMMIVHCVIHRENLVAKKLSPALNEVLRAMIICVNSIKTRPKAERIFKQFCENQNAEHVRLLLHTEIRWLSCGNCLKRFMELFDLLSNFLCDTSEMKFLLSTDGKTLLSYLCDIFEKLGSQNRQLQGKKITLLDVKTKIFAFIASLEFYKKNLCNGVVSQFHWLSKCNITDYAFTVINEHLKMLITDFNDRFSDLREMDFPGWLTQPLLIDIAEVDTQFQEELFELQQDELLKTLFKLKNMNMWLCDETERKYPRISSFAKNMLIPFPSSYLVECGFSAITNLLDGKRNKLDVTKRGDLRLKLTALTPRIDELCREHQSHGSH